jgi:hypothetical protein
MTKNARRRQTRRKIVKSLIITCTIALVAFAGPLGSQLRADDAHHPEKAAKVKKSTATKPKRQKKPPVKTEKSSQSEVSPALPAREA